jgi:hypothetical protein
MLSIYNSSKNYLQFTFNTFPLFTSVSFLSQFPILFIIFFIVLISINIPTSLSFMALVKNISYLYESQYSFDFHIDLYYSIFDILYYNIYEA